MFWFEKHQIVGSHSLSHNVSLSLSSLEHFPIYRSHVHTNDQTFDNLGFGDEGKLSQIYIIQPVQERLEYTFSDLGPF